MAELRVAVGGADADLPERLDREIVAFNAAATGHHDAHELSVAVRGEQDGSVVGFATWGETSGITELEDLFVDPDYRRRGIAAALVSRIAQVLRARGAGRLEVTANPHAMEFYRAAGFTDDGTAETDFGSAPCMVLMLS